MKTFIRSNLVISFILITFIYSWSLWILMILSNRGQLPFKFPTNFLGSFGPMVGALSVSAVINGQQGIKKIFKSMVKWKNPLPAYALSILFIIIVYAITTGMRALMGAETLIAGKFPGIAELLLYFVIIAVIGGPMGEEIGWRGFLQPVLMKNFTPVVTSFIIAFIWLLWHVPLFWLEGAAQEGASILYFAISVLAMSIIFTWLYMRSKGSLFQAVLFHTMINCVSAFIIPSVLPQTANDKTFGRISSLILLVSALGFMFVFRKEFFIKNESTDSLVNESMALN